MFEISVDPARKLTTIRLHRTDDSAAVQVADAFGRALDDPAVDSDFSILVLVEADARPPSEQDIGRIASLMREVADRVHGRIAAVVTAVGHATPAHLIEALSESSVTVFREEKEARRWIAEQRESSRA